jgi:hypothetical protein
MTSHLTKEKMVNGGAIGVSNELHIASYLRVQGFGQNPYGGKRRGATDCEMLQAYLSDSLFGEDFPSYALGGCMQGVELLLRPQLSSCTRLDPGMSEPHH